MQYKFKINDQTYEANVIGEEDNILEIVLNGETIKVELEDNRPKAVEQQEAVESVPLAQQTASPTSHVQHNQVSLGSKSKNITSPLPGVILEVKVAVGDTIKRGQTVMIIEAMKMENNIEATADGTIATINRSKGDAVMEGDILITLQ